MATPLTALCLSGGGFRATLFHLGALRRLNELGVLSKIDVITSVSGGSILNGMLATRWQDLTLEPGGSFVDFDEKIVDPVIAFCGDDLRTPLLLGTRLNPANFGTLIRDAFSVRANFLAKGYRKLMPQDLAKLPSPDATTPSGAKVPRFVFIATNVSTGLSWQFHCGKDARMGDFHAGYWPVGETTVAEAVAASSAFPPGFSALRLSVPEKEPSPRDRVDPWGIDRPAEGVRVGQQHIPRSGKVLLTDGGVYDNLGIEPVWNRGHWILVSDSQQLFQSNPEASQWFVARLGRTVDIVMEQVSALRKRWLFDRATTSKGQWCGVIWRLSSDPTTFPKHQPGYGVEPRQRLTRVRTDLNSFALEEAGCLQNMGYWVADSAIQSHWKGPCGNPNAPFTWPYPELADEAKALNALAQSHRRRIARDIWVYVRKKIWR
jgi:NTE family protein